MTGTQARRHEGTEGIPLRASVPSCLRAFTLIEMLTTVAALVIVLGLMVSLARDVRHRSADHLTKDILRRLDGLVAQYRKNCLPGMSVEQKRMYPIIKRFNPPIEGEEV